MSNPFFYGGKIVNPADFVGRQSELRKIFAGLDKFSTGQAQHFAITGTRRIGKSSLLYHLTQVYPHWLRASEKYRFAYIDLDDPRCRIQPHLLAHILNSLKVKTHPRPTLETFYDAIVALRHQGICPVLCVDEFEHLVKHKSEFPDLLFETWRSLGDNSRLAFITASRLPLADLLTTAHLTSSFHNIFSHLPLGEFTEEEARALLARNTERPFSEAEQKKLFALSGYHPAKLQIAASLLYDAKGDETCDWQAIQKNFKEQWEQIRTRKLATAPANKGMPWLTFLFVSIPRAIGRFLLDLLGRDKAADSSAALLGWGVIGIAAAILLRWLAWNDLLALWYSLQQPPPTP